MCVRSAGVGYVYLGLCFKEKAADRMPISDWSSDVVSSDLNGGPSDNDEIFRGFVDAARGLSAHWHDKAARLAAGEEPGFDLITMLQSNEDTKIGRASCRERVCQYV